MIHVKYSLFRKKDTFYTKLKHNHLNSLTLYPLQMHRSSQTGVLDNQRRNVENNYTQVSLNELICVQMT